jgi:uncharacterized protein
MKVGVVSDTHGLLRPEVLPALEGVEAIFHAGDVGDATILDSLRAVAPVHAIRGNVDTIGPTAKLPAEEAIEVGGHFIYMLHSVEALDIHPRASGISAVISGHTHKPLIEYKHGVLFLNPGSCGPRRFKLPVTLALLYLEDGRPARAELVHLEI